ncbi:MAG: DUF6265 family protein [Phenylobacterium sp.]|uniref:DUF6265 family protein n=1 Tax=Phenylobacterium sp. TaxID=1871053 RepID=UPI00391B81C7
MHIPAAALALMMSAAGVDDLAWMAGSWRLEAGGVVTREAWLSPMDGTMAGVTQTHRPGRPPEVEFATIVADSRGVTFTARVEGQPPTPFRRKPGAEGEAVFENLEHDFPQRIVYRRCGEDLCARIEGVVRGDLRSQDWRYRRER